MEEFKMKQQAPYIRAKDFDHEDIEMEFTADETLNMFFKVGMSFVVFALLLVAIYVLANIAFVVGAWWQRC